MPLVWTKVIYFLFQYISHNWEIFVCVCHLRLNEVILFWTRNNWAEKRSSSSKAIDRWIRWLASVRISEPIWFQVECINFWLAGIHILLYRYIYLSLFSRYNILSTFLYYLQKTIIRLRQYNNDILVALWVGPDIQDSDEHIVQVSVGV